MGAISDITEVRKGITVCFLGSRPSLTLVLELLSFRQEVKYLDQHFLEEFRIDFAQLPFEIYGLVR